MDTNKMSTALSIPRSTVRSIIKKWQVLYPLQRQATAIQFEWKKKHSHSVIDRIVYLNTSECVLIQKINMLYYRMQMGKNT